MTNFLVLLAWTSAGGLLAAVLPCPGEQRTAWLPMALIFGPLWAPIAVDRHESVSAAPEAAD